MLLESQELLRLNSVRVETPGKYKFRGSKYMSQDSHTAQRDRGREEEIENLFALPSTASAMRAT
jgi:hypothetical protein